MVLNVAGIDKCVLKSIDDGTVCELPVVNVEIDESDEDKKQCNSIINNTYKLSASFSMNAKICRESAMFLCGVRESIVQLCNDKRVVHLMNNHKKAKIRNKNLNRAIRILERL